MLPGRHVTKLIGIGFFAAPPVHEVRPFIIDPGMEFVELVTDGTIFFEVNGRDLRLGCGALFWHQTGESTIFRTRPESPYRCMTARFKVREGSKRPVPEFTFIENPNRVHELVRELLGAFHGEPGDKKFLCQYAYQRLLWEAHRSVRRGRNASRPAGVERAVAYIEEHFAGELSTVDLAEAAGISEPHLHTLFRTHLTSTPHQFLLERRIREARLLLAGSDRPIKSIATQCGFANIETFYRCFKKLAGMPPKAYRERHADPSRIDRISSQ